MMNFRVVQQALIDTLGGAAAGRFRVTGYRGQGHDAREVQNSKRLVQVYYSSGDFPKSSGRFTGATQHKPIFNVDVTVSASARADLSVLASTTATPIQIQTALSAGTDAAYEADVLLDEVGELAYQILMDGRNLDLGLTTQIMSSRWVDRFSKGEVGQHGSLVVATGQLQYSCQMVEEVEGDPGVEAETPSVYTRLDIIGDDVEQTY